MKKLKGCIVFPSNVIINRLKIVFYRILRKLPENSHWENVELEQFRNSQFQFGA